MSSKFTIALAILATSFLYEQYGDRSVRSPSPWRGWRWGGRKQKKEKFNDEWNSCAPCELCPPNPVNMLVNGNFEDNDPLQHNPWPGHRQDFAVFVDTTAISPWTASTQWRENQDTVDKLHELSGPFTPVSYVETNKRQKGNEAQDWDVRGTWGLDLNPDKPIKISQTVSGIENGQRYRLSFLLSSNRCKNFAADPVKDVLEGRPPKYNPRVKSGYFEVQGQQFAFAYDTQLHTDNIAVRITHTFKDLVAGDAEISIASTTRGAGSTACGPVIDNVKFVKVCSLKKKGGYKKMRKGGYKKKSKSGYKKVRKGGYKKKSKSAYKKKSKSGYKKSKSGYKKNNNKGKY